MEEQYFGPHLLVDCFGCDTQSLWDEGLIEQFLLLCIERAGMKLIMGPYTTSYKGIEPLDAGVTGIAVLAESHITAHTFPYREGFITFDLYSCKDFPVDEIVQLIQDTFNCERIDHRVIDRGVGFLRDKLVTVQHDKLIVPG